MRPKTIIIAEAGVNHNGDFELAKKLVDAAAGANADYVKFQTFKTEKLTSSAAKMAEYQKNNLNLSEDEGQFGMLKKLEFSKAQFEELADYSKSKRIGFLSTPFDVDSFDLLNDFDLDFWKIASGEITNLPLLEKFASSKKPIVLSTGMCNLMEVGAALQVFLNFGYKKSEIKVLHCNTEYPTPFSDVNLRAMKDIASLGVQIGYSDHTLGIEIPIAAVALGAVVIEKHFTLDRTLPGPDHPASLEPDELKQMVSAIRNIEEGLGSDKKVPTESEKKNIAIARKSIHINQALKAGEKLKESHFSMLRPGDGISPMGFRNIVGKVIFKDLPSGHKLEYSDFK
ncbi:MAG: N-acetylneuraminate synthase [Salibacteraceae bacterium]|nr:N-acetylneuraminate synthase [Salibacteraceae bacterium]